MIYLLISLFLDLLLGNILNTTYQHLNYFFPLIFITSLTLSYILIKNYKIFFPTIILIGIIYDTLYSDIFLLNTYYFILSSLFLYIFYKNKSPSILNIILISTSIFLMYDIYIFFTLILLDYSVFKIDYLLYKLIRTFPLNFIYLIISVLILKSRIFGSKKKSLRF